MSKTAKATDQLKELAEAGFEICKPDERGGEDAPKLIRAKGEPHAMFEEEPIRIMRAVRLVAEYGLGLYKPTYEAMLQKAPLLENVGADRIRPEFEKIISARHAGKGLKMLAKADLMPYIIGELSGKMTKRELDQFAILAENIDKTNMVAERRLGLFYICFERKKGIEAAKRLNYEPDMEQKILDAIHSLDKIYFLSNPFELKQFLAQYGARRYEYLDDLSKAQRIVYDLGETKIMSRDYMLKEIRSKGEPIFVEDLAIGEGDLEDKGIASGEAAREMLLMLTDVVHKNPKLNTKKDLLAHAEKFSKSKIRAAFRKVRWLK